MAPVLGTGMAVSLPIPAVGSHFLPTMHRAAMPGWSISQKRSTLMHGSNVMSRVMGGPGSSVWSAALFHLFADNCGFDSVNLSRQLRVDNL